MDLCANPLYPSLTVLVGIVVTSVIISALVYWFATFFDAE